MDRIRTWIDPSDFDSALIRNQNLRTEGTTLWLLEERMYDEWKDSTIHGDVMGMKNTKVFQSNILWLIGKCPVLHSHRRALPGLKPNLGNPGYGKTVLACTVIEDNLSESSQNPGHGQFVCYFLFESGLNGANTKITAYRAFLSQILQSHQSMDGVLDAFTFVRDCKSHGQQRATESEMLDLLRFMCRLVDKVVFILDGIDECEDQRDLITDMLSLSSIPSTHLMFFSRPNVPDLLRLVPRHRRFHLDGRTIGDVQTYIQMKMVDLDQRGLLPEGIENTDLSARLARRAAGMFLWITLMMAYLFSPCLTTFERLEALEETNLPEGLDEIYNKILHLISKSGSRSKILAQRILAWMLYGYRPLDVRELEVALLVSTKTNKETSRRMDSYRNFADTIIITCGGLVHVHNDQLRLCHLSLRDHLLQNDSLSNRSYPGGIANTDYFHLVPSNGEAHLEMALASVKSLTLNGPTRRLSEELGTNFTMESLNQNLPFHSYASEFWIMHAGDAVKLVRPQFQGQRLPSLNELWVAIFSFFSRRLAIMVWVESCYWLGVTPWRRRLQALGLQLQESRLHQTSSPVIVDELGRDATQLSCDLDLLDREWGPQLLTDPGILWEEVTAFTHSRFLLKTSATVVKYLNLDKIEDVRLSSCYLKEISVTVSDNKYIAKLSIWPSR